MTYYIVRSPVTGMWMREPFQGVSDDQSEAWSYPADHPHMAYMVAGALYRGVKLRLRQVMVVEEDA